MSGSLAIQTPRGTWPSSFRRCGSRWQCFSCGPDALGCHACSTSSPRCGWLGGRCASYWSSVLCSVRYLSLILSAGGYSGYFMAETYLDAPPPWRDMVSSIVEMGTFVNFVLLLVRVRHARAYHRTGVDAPPPLDGRWAGNRFQNARRIPVVLCAGRRVAREPPETAALGALRHVTAAGVYRHRANEDDEIRESRRRRRQGTVRPDIKQRGHMA